MNFVILPPGLEDEDAVLLRSGLLKYTANPAIRETTATAIRSALRLSLFIIIQNPLSKLIT
jgi:hypothetical protein